MWNPVRVLITQAQEIASLLAEQNSLLRELIQFHTRRPAQTALRAAAQAIPVRPLGPKRTAKDVWSGAEERQIPTTEDEARVAEVLAKMQTQQAAQTFEIPQTPAT